MSPRLRDEWLVWGIIAAALIAVAVAVAYEFLTAA